MILTRWFGTGGNPRHVVMRLDKLFAVGRRAAGGRAGRRLQRLAQVREDLADGPPFRDERNQLDIAATSRALQRKLLAQPRRRPSMPCRSSFCCRARRIGVPATAIEETKDSSIKALIVKTLKDTDLNLDVGRHFIDETVVVWIFGTVERHVYV